MSQYLLSPDAIWRLHSWVNEFSQQPNPLLPLSRHSSREEDLRILLLAAALFQKIELGDLSQLLHLLRDEYGSDLFSLPEPRRKRLKEILPRTSQWKIWDLKEFFPGIIWSVGEFCRKHDSLEKLSEKLSRSEWIDILKREVFFMGRSSSRPLKPTIFLAWLRLPVPAGLGLPLVKPSLAEQIPYTPGASRWLFGAGPLAGAELPENLSAPNFFDAFCREQFPEIPETASYALSFFRQVHQGNRLCGECGGCVLRQDCPEGKREC